MLARIEKALRRGTSAPRYALDGLLYRRSPYPKRIECLRNANKGRPMLIVGNGPSLRQTPLDQFAGIFSIGMNKIDLLFPDTTWRPSMVICSNTMVARQHADRWSQMDIPLYLSWKSRWFVPKSLHSRITFFHTLTERSFCVDLAKGFGFGHTVTYAALQLAYFMGANPVVIVGVDHSFKFQGTPLEYRKMSEEDENHFVPDYFSKGQLWGLPDLVGSELDYTRAREAFSKENRCIVDATVGGKLRVFERVSIDDAIRLCRDP